jgi:hypothetical protein
MSVELGKLGLEIGHEKSDALHDWARDRYHLVHPRHALPRQRPPQSGCHRACVQGGSPWGVPLHSIHTVGDVLLLPGRSTCV